jgi:hypothetical protein
MGRNEFDASASLHRQRRYSRELLTNEGVEDAQILGGYGRGRKRTNQSFVEPRTVGDGSGITPTHGDGIGGQLEVTDEVVHTIERGSGDHPEDSHVFSQI